MISITDGKGFHLTFENGLGISVQIGIGNYCDNRQKKQLGSMPTSTTAEIGIWDKNNDWVTHWFLPKKRGLDVVGYVKADEIAKLIKRVQNKKMPNP